MDFETRARSAAQDVNRAIEVMEMSTDTKQPRKVERFDRYQDRKDRNRKVGAVAVAAVIALVAIVVARNVVTRPDGTQVGVHPPVSWPITPPGNGAFTVDLTTGTAAPLPASIRDAGRSYAVSPDRTLVAYGLNDLHSPLFLANIDGTGIRRLTPQGAGGAGPQWSPDGSELVYQQLPAGAASNVVGNLYIYDVRTGRSTQITHLDGSAPTDGSWFMFPSFMPTDRGLKVLFQEPTGTKHQDWEGWDLWSVPVSGGTPVLVQKDAGWGAVGQNGKIAYANPGTTSGVGLVVRSLRSPGPVVIVDWVPGVFNPAWVRWSPDGTRVAFSADGGIYVLNADGFSKTKIVAGRGNAEWYDNDTLVVGN